MSRLAALSMGRRGGGVNGLRLAQNCSSPLHCPLKSRHSRLRKSALRATQTRGQQSNDFNVMTARHLRKPQVTVEHDGALLPAGATLALFALGEVTVNGELLQRHDLLLTDQEVRMAGRWPVVAVRLFGEMDG